MANDIGTSPVNIFNIKRILVWTGSIVILLSVCGLANQYFLLREFGVDLSDFADIDDFLVASINLLMAFEYAGSFEIISIVVYLIICIVMIVLSHMRPDNNSHNSHGELPLPGKNGRAFKIKLLLRSILVDVYFTKGMYFIFFALLISSLSILIAKHQANEILAGNVCKLEMYLQKPESGFKKVVDGSCLYPITGLNSTFFVLEAKCKDKSEDPGKNVIATHSLPYINISQIVTQCKI